MLRSPAADAASAAGEAAEDQGSDAKPAYATWESPYRSGQMAPNLSPSQQRPTADHSARRRRGGAGGGTTNSPGHGHTRTTPPRGVRTTPSRASPGRPPTMAGQRDLGDSPGLGATLGAALNGALGTLDINTVRGTSPVKGDIAPGDESQIAAHEFRGLWAASEKKRQKADAECFQRRRENEQLKERLTNLEGRLRGTLESSGGAKSQLRGTQHQLQELEQEMSQLQAGEAPRNPHHNLIIRDVSERERDWLCFQNAPRCSAPARSTPRRATTARGSSPASCAPPSRRPPRKYSKPYLHHNLISVDVSDRLLVVAASSSAPRPLRRRSRAWSASAAPSRSRSATPRQSSPLPRTALRRPRRRVNAM